jgi:hypothetical protein
MNYYNYVPTLFTFEFHSYMKGVLIILSLFTQCIIPKLA